MRSTIVALIMGGTVLVGTGASALATPSEPIAPAPVSVIARTSVADLLNQGIPPNPIIPVVNRGRFVSAFVIPSDPILPTD